jgi:hypothetical protein
MGQPQFGDEAREAHEQRGVEQALSPEYSMPYPPHGPQAESDDEHARRLCRVTINDGLSVNPGRRSAGEVQRPADVLA